MGNQRIGDAVLEVFFQDQLADGLQRRARGLDLGDDVDTVFTVADHPLYALDLPLDAREAGGVFRVRCRVAFHCGEPFLSSLFVSQIIIRVAIGSVVQ